MIYKIRKYIILFAVKLSGAQMVAQGPSGRCHGPRRGILRYLWGWNRAVGGSPLSGGATDIPETVRLAPHIVSHIFITFWGLEDWKFGHEMTIGRGGGVSNGDSTFRFFTFNFIFKIGTYRSVYRISHSLSQQTSMNSVTQETMPLAVWLDAVDFWTHQWAALLAHWWCKKNHPSRAARRGYLWVVDEIKKH